MLTNALFLCNHSDCHFSLFHRMCGRVESSCPDRIKTHRRTLWLMALNMKMNPCASDLIERKQSEWLRCHMTWQTCSRPSAVCGMRMLWAAPGGTDEHMICSWLVDTVNSHIGFRMLCSVLERFCIRCSTNDLENVDVALLPLDGQPFRTAFAAKHRKNSFSCHDLVLNGFAYLWHHQHGWVCDARYRTIGRIWIGHLQIYR